MKYRQYPGHPDYIITDLDQEFYQKHVQELLDFCDLEIGKNFYNSQNFPLHLNKSLKDGQNSSFVAISKETGNIVAMRLTYAPGTWMREYRMGLSPHLWNVPSEHVACFKSLFIHQAHQQKGLGKILSNLAIDHLRKQGAMAIISHSSLGSPQNSSKKYLTSMGFLPLKEHPLFWQHIPYFCGHCSKSPCECTALEMILYLE